MQTAQALLEAKLRGVVSAGETPVEVTTASDARFGDYQTNIAMLLAKQQRKNPREVAATLLAQLDVSGICEPPEIAGAGFINFRLRADFVAAQLRAIVDDPCLGVPQAVPARRIVVDFSGPNIAKPMHVGHIRSTILGDCLVRIGRFLGHEMIGDNHLGDWGTQFGMVIYGWKHQLDTEALERDGVGELVRLYKEINALSAESAEVKQFCRQELVKLQAGDPENIAIWKRCIEISRLQFEKIYETLDVHFDEWLGESSYNDRLEPLVERLERLGLAETSEGATCVFFRDHPTLSGKPCLIRKGDGGFLYATTDLATIDYRVERWRPDAMWYVAGAPQQTHFAEVFEIARRMGITAELRHIPFGSILGEDRKLMKTRSGDNVLMRELLDEAIERASEILREKSVSLSPDEQREVARVVGIGAVKYAELSQSRVTDYIFSWEKMLSFQGNTAPYLQNAYVRIRAIFRRLGQEWSGAASFLLNDPAELGLARKLLQFGETVPAVLHDFRPNLLANYLYELANSFHAFYEACPVIKAPEAARETRLALCAATARVMKQGLELLGIQVTEKM